MSASIQVLRDLRFRLEDSCVASRAKDRVVWTNAYSGDARPCLVLWDSGKATIIKEKGVSDEYDNPNEAIEVFLALQF